MDCADQHVVLLAHAAIVGPEAVALVERVGRDRTRPLFWDYERRREDGTAAAFYGVAPGPANLFLVLEKELRRIVEVRPLRPDRFRFLDTDR